MNKTEFLIGRSGLDLQDDFYPTDLPQDWRFDYYAAIFKTLSLPIDTDEDLEQIFNDIEEDQESEFTLVLTINCSQLTDIIILKKYLNEIQGYSKNFILFCEVDKTPNREIIKLLFGYKVCFQSSKRLKLNLQEVQVLGVTLSFNQYPILYFSQILDEKQMRTYLDSIVDINTKTILIFKFSERETLDKIRIISELLGF